MQAPEQTAQDTHAHEDPAAALRAAGKAPVQTRSERPRSYDVEAFAVPTGREVNWKHTPLDRVRALFEAAPQNDGIATVVAPSEYLVAPLAIGESPRGEFFVPEDRVAAVAWRGASKALHVRIPAEHEVAEPIVVSIDGQGAEKRADAHLVIEALPGSKATVVLNHAGSVQLAENVEILVRDGAQLTLVTVQRWQDDAVHVASHQARVDRDATLKHIVASFGGGVVRVNPNVELSGQGSEGVLSGVAFADAGQHIESQVYLFHKGAHTTGDVLYKTALQGESARTAWIGDVLIGNAAVGTDSYEANRNLLLNPGARADSIPNLEIQTGDIQGAGHASATGRFDDEQLFYLQARGIPEEEARRVVVLGFLVEIVQRIGIDQLEEELTALIEQELAEGGKAA